jgi:GNAT superfamily N-acetyltransferase
VIRPCEDSEIDQVWSIINDGAQVYRGVIPTDRWKEPYMSREELRQQIGEGVEFWGYQEKGLLLAVMGTQRVKDVTLIRHAYVLSSQQKRGLGSQLLNWLRGLTSSPVLIGTWRDAVWAIRFYERHGFAKVGDQEKDWLLRRYWNIPERQIETSVVLADQRWRDAQS